MDHGTLSLFVSRKTFIELALSGLKVQLPILTPSQSIGGHIQYFSHATSRPPPQHPVFCPPSSRTQSTWGFCTFHVAGRLWRISSWDLHIIVAPPIQSSMTAATSCRRLDFRMCISRAAWRDRFGILSLMCLTFGVLEQDSGST